MLLPLVRYLLLNSYSPTLNVAFVVDGLAFPLFPLDVVAVDCYPTLPLPVVVAVALPRLRYLFTRIYVAPDRFATFTLYIIGWLVLPLLIGHVYVGYPLVIPLLHCSCVPGLFAPLLRTVYPFAVTLLRLVTVGLLAPRFYVYVGRYLILPAFTFGCILVGWPGVRRYG